VKDEVISDPGVIEDKGRVAMALHCQVPLHVVVSASEVIGCNHERRRLSGGNDCGGRSITRDGNRVKGSEGREGKGYLFDKNFGNLIFGFL
jgi:hypothetical protein